MGLTPGLSHRQGERRSRHKGPGLEFAGHRPYREGDDLRHIDARVYARLRAPYTREFLADRQMRVAILIDSSASMKLADGSAASGGKIGFAQKLACLLSLAGLGSGDLVEIGVALGHGDSCLVQIYPSRLGGLPQQHRRNGEPA